MINLLIIFFGIGVITGANNQSTKSGRIVGGKNAHIAEFPYQVSIMYIDYHFCGGSIIRPNFVLSAAHCYVGIQAESLLVRAGSSYCSEGGQLAGVSLIVQHNHYDQISHDFDISVLKLDRFLNFGLGVVPIRLPISNEVFDGAAVATGWGRLSNNGLLPAQLQKVVLPLWPNKKCVSAYGSRITGNMICAGYVHGGQDTCQGDSGGPLALNGVLVGITSWGNGCAAANSPGVYTKVSAVRDFIDSIIY